MIASNKQKGLSRLVKDADTVFSSYIRQRDAHSDGRIRCFVCGVPVPWKSSHCGHFIDRDQMAVRYDEMNAHAICFGCNVMDDNHRVKYELTMLNKYGTDQIDALELKAKGLQKFMRHELLELIEDFKVKIKELKS